MPYVQPYVTNKRSSNQKVGSSDKSLEKLVVNDKPKKESEESLKSVKKKESAPKVEPNKEVVEIEKVPEGNLRP